MVFLLVATGDTVSSVLVGAGGSGVSGLDALDSFSVCLRGSPSSATLISLSIRSMSPLLSCALTVLSYLLGAAWLTQPNVTISDSLGNNCSI